MTTPITSQETVDQDQVIHGLLADGRRRAYLREVDALASGSRGEKLEAATALLQYGEAALEPLCSALSDPDDRIKVAAARALAELGDSRAVPSLTAALRKGLSGGTARSHFLAAGRAVFWAIGATTVAGCVVTLLGVPLLYSLLGYPPCIITLNWLLARRARSRVHQVFTDVIVALAEAKPTPELRELLPDLRMLAVDRLQQEPEARQAFSGAAERIDLLTRDLRVLPIAATGPPLDTDALPRPAKASEPGAENLPVVGSDSRRVEP